MAVSLRHPLLGHAAIFASLVLSVGVVRTVYVEPRVREAKALRSGEQRLQTELVDLQSGNQDLGEYLGDIEALDQLVVVRSIAMQSGMPQPELAADVTIWLYGTP